MARRKPTDTTTGTPGAHHDGLFRWVADFEPVAGESTAASPVGQARPASKAHAATEKRLGRLVGASGLLITMAAAIAAVLVPFRGEGDPAATGGPRVLDAPRPRPSASAEAPLVPAMLPQDCSGLYGDAMLAEFERQSMELNQVWTGVREETAGSDDPELVSILAGRPSLDCYWLDESGGTDAAVLTVATEVSPEESAAVEARLVALGFAHQKDRGGIRYFVESRVDAQSKGESHFLRDGVWLATNWYGFGPWGYTRHMAENVFG